MNPNRPISEPYLTDEEIVCYLSEYDEQGFEALPSWLQQELQVRHITFQRREPTELEKWETIADAREHRILNNEKTIKDYMDKYKRGKPFHTF